MSANSAGAYTATLLAMVNVIKGVGAVHPPPSPAKANFTLMTECTPESSGCNSVYYVGETFSVLESDPRHLEVTTSINLGFSLCFSLLKERFGSVNKFTDPDLGGPTLIRPEHCSFH